MMTLTMLGKHAKDMVPIFRDRPFSARDLAEEGVSPVTEIV